MRLRTKRYKESLRNDHSYSYAIVNLVILEAEVAVVDMVLEEVVATMIA